MTLNQLLDQAVGQYADVPAVRGTDFSFTYKEFHVRVLTFASCLVSSGVQPGTFVGICTQRSPEMMIGIFGILRAGAAYLPIDPSHPSQRISSLLADAGCTFVVTTSDMVEFIQSFGCKAIVPFSEPVDHLMPVPLPVVSGHDTAYILFTSGSEGLPKGVMIAHHSVVNLVSYIQHAYPLKTGDVVLLKSPYTFDGSVWELFGWILMGGTLYVAPQGAEKDPKWLWQIIRQERVSFLFFVPPMLGAFLEFSAFGDPSDVGGLKWISVGGEVLPANMVKRFYEVFDHRKVGLINVYGPTETTVYATTHLCTPTGHLSKIPIGKAVKNDFIYILDEQRNRVADGEEGEIWVGGAGVAKGYLNNPDLTQQKFVSDPFASDGLMYRTGDLGRKNDDGTYDFTGRKDFQIKLRGLRIEPGEIEYALQTVEEIAESVVLFSKDNNHDDCLVAYIRLYDEHYLSEYQEFVLAGEPLVTIIREKIARWLPEYMIPAYMVVCRRFQLTAHEKIDRRALPSLTQVLVNEPEQEYIPHTETGRTVIRLWKQVLGISLIGPDDDFFSTGGHSLKAVQLIALVIKEFGVEVPLRDFYQGMTPVQMTEGIEQNNYPAIPEIVQRREIISSHEGFPITPVQTEMWILHSLDPTGLIHNIQIEFLLKGRPDLDRFKEALRSTLDAEEIFRSVFKPHKGVPFQHIVNTLPFRMNESDLSALSDEDKGHKYSEICRSNGHILFDTEKGPLFSFYLVTWDQQEYRLLMAVHHLVFDGWSLYLFMERLSLHYAGRSSPPHPWRNVDYVEYLNGQQIRERIASERSYWMNELKNLPRRWYLPQRADAKPEMAGRQGDRYWWKLDHAISDGIDRTAQAWRSTPFSLFMTAFELSLAAWNNQNDIIVGTPFANRNHEIVNGLIGYYTNMVSIRLSWNDTTTLYALVNQCNEKSISAFSSATLPFGEVARSLGSLSDLGSNPVYHAIFVLQNWPHNDFPFDGFTLQQREIGNQTAKTDMLLNVERQGDGYTCWLEYDTMLYDEATTMRLAAAINRSLTAMVNVTDLTVKELLKELQEIIKPVEGFRCYVVGEGKLAARCIERLEQKGFLVERIITTDDWLFSQNPERTSKADILVQPGDNLGPVDYIFSISNSLILRQEFLSLAGKMAVNYHDAPLPRFAGMFATNWAILTGSTLHGVSWHVITDMIDAGDLLATTPVAVLPDDTALTLNTRCFEAALASFETLTDDMLHNSLRPVAQDLSERTLFPLAMRPAFFGSLYPSMPVSEADRLLRATRTGPGFDNEFALPWLHVNGELFIITEAAIHAGIQGNPGMFDTVSGIPGFYCLDGFVAISSLYDADCKPVDLLKRFSEHRVMETPDPGQCERAAGFFKKIARHESFWRKQFETAEFLKWPFMAGDTHAGKTVCELSVDQINSISHLFPGISSVDFLASATLMLLIQLNDRNAGTVGYLPEIPVPADGEYFSPWIPFQVQLQHGQTGEAALISAINALQSAEKTGTFVRSLRLRYKQLQRQADQLPEIMISKSAYGLIQFPHLLHFIVSDRTVTVIPPGTNPYPATDRFMRCFGVWMSNLLADPGLAMNQVSCVDEALPREAVSIPFIQPAEMPRSMDVITLFIEMASNFPDAIAVVDQDRSITYRHFLGDIMALSAILTARQVKMDDVVAIAMERNYCNMLSIMAVLHCGACFLPLDPGLPPQRTGFILHDAGVSLMLVDSDAMDHSSIVPRLNVASVIGEGNRSAVIPQAAYQPGSGAYILYTSGSTGRPKGVVISRVNLSAFVGGALSAYDIQSSDKILQFASLSFDACIEEIFCSFCSGATLLLRNDDMLQPDELMHFTLRQAVTVWDLPTAFWRQLIHSEEYKRQASETSLRLVIIGGEAVTPNDINDWRAIPGRHRLMNTYGPTETTVVALTYPVPGVLNDQSVVPIGKPFPGYHARIVNSRRMLVPPGMSGELIIAGGGVASGYLNRPEEEEKAFIRMALPGTGPQRWYCTGDRVFLNDQGDFCFLGRMDHQVKIRGFRVEPDEIENQIAKIERITGCKVIVHGSPGDLRLAAFYTTADQRPLSENIKEILSQYLPAYMVPQEILFIEKMPLTQNGKADTDMLTGLIGKAGRQESDRQDRPAGPTEIFLAEAWQKILEVEPPGINDDFFELGGHSLKAVSLMAEIKKHRGITVPLASLIQNSTIRKFAAYLDRETGHFQWNCLVPIRPGGSRTPLFLIHGAGMNVLLYQSLVKHLPPDRPIYAFQAAGLDGKREMKTSIEAMAAEYLEEMLKVQPRGPYLLLGFSLGGFIAYEMSQKLTAMGHTAGLTGLIDSVAYLADFSDSSIKKMLIRTWSNLARPLYTLWLFFREPNELKIGFLLNKFRRVRLSLLWFLSSSGLKKTRNLKQDIEQQSFLSDKVLLFMNEVLRKYKIKKAGFAVDLFAAGKATFYIYDRKRYGWSHFTPAGFKKHLLPGEHSMLFAPPNDAVFAEKLEERLTEVEQQQQHP